MEKIYYGIRTVTFKELWQTRRSGRAFNGQTVSTPEETIAEINRRLKCAKNNLVLFNEYKNIMEKNP